MSSKFYLLSTSQVEAVSEVAIHLKGENEFEFILEKSKRYYEKTR